MPGPLDSPRHESFCVEYVANGCNGAEAYRKSYGKSRDCRNPERRAADLIRRNEDIAARIRELQRSATNGRIMSATALMEYLVQGILADPEQVLAEKLESDTKGQPQSKLIQSIRFKDGKPVEIKVIDKLRAAELLAKLAGMVTDKLEVVDKTPREPISELRKRVTESMERHSRS